MFTFFVVIPAAFLLVPSAVFADSGEDVQKLIWKGETNWKNIHITGKNLEIPLVLTRGSPVGHLENVFEAAVESNKDLPRVELKKLEYEFMETSVVILSKSESRISAALQLLFVGIETSNVGEYLSIVVPVSGLLSSDDQKTWNAKLRASLANLGRESTDGIYSDSLTWLESVLKKSFVDMEDSTLVDPSFKMYNHIYMSKAEYVPYEVLKPFTEAYKFPSEN